LFPRTNRILTAMWGGVFLVTALLGLLALHVKSGSDWLNWVIPIALLVAAVRFTKWYPAHVRAQARAWGRPEDGTKTAEPTEATGRRRVPRG
jgi:hypothetical protein